MCFKRIQKIISLIEFFYGHFHSVKFSFICHSDIEAVHLKHGIVVLMPIMTDPKRRFLEKFFQHADRFRVNIGRNRRFLDGLFTDCLFGGGTGYPGGYPALFIPYAQIVFPCLSLCIRQPFFQ